MPAMIKALNIPESKSRTRMAWLLGRLGPRAKPAVPRMINILRDPTVDDDARWAMAINLADIGECEEQAVPILLELLEAKSWQLRNGAVLALGKLGHKDNKVVPALVKALKDPHVTLQGNAAISLGRLGKEPDICVPAMVNALRSLKGYQGNNDPRLGILLGLGRFSAMAADAVPLICETAEDSNNNDFLRECAIRCLGEIGPAAQAAVPTLKYLSISKKKALSTINKEARRALARITGSDH
jgi:HEAT repeat protein